MLLCSKLREGRIFRVSDKASSTSRCTMPPIDGRRPRIPLRPLQFGGSRLAIACFKRTGASRPRTFQPWVMGVVR